jgi:hypothetical protein
MKFIRDIISDKRAASSVAAMNRASDRESIRPPVQPEAVPETDALHDSRVDLDLDALSEASAEIPEIDAQEPLSDEDSEMTDIGAIIAGLDEQPQTLAADEEDDDEASEEFGVSEIAESESAVADTDDGSEDEAEEETLNLGDPFEKLMAQNNMDGSGSAPGAASDKRPVFSQLSRNRPEASVRRAGLSVSAPVQPFPAPSVAAEQSAIDVPAPAMGRGSSRSGRVKTRLLGFTPGAQSQADPFAAAGNPANTQFPVGWLVVTSDAGRGASFPLPDGVARIGRGEDQTVSLNFGDNSISRENHVSIAYDSETNKFFIGHSGKTNLVRLNNMPLLSTEQLRSRDVIRVGETTLRFVALCEDDFSWTSAAEKAVRHA